MAFFSKKFVKVTSKWVPITKTVSCYDAQRLARDIEKECTVSYTDVISVLTAIPGVMRRYLAEGHSVKLDGIGSFFLTFECKKTGVDTAEEVSMDQVTNVKVQFRPAMRGSGVKGKFANTLIADDIEWTYLPSAKLAATDGNTPMEPEGNAGTGSNAEGSDLEG